MLEPETSCPLGDNRPRLRFKLRTALIAGAFCLGLLVAGPLAWFHYERGTAAALDMAAELVQQAGDRVLLRTREQTEPLRFLAETVPLMPGATSLGKGFDHPLLPLLLHLMREAPQIYSAYFGDGRGEFLQVVALSAHPEARGQVKAPAEAAFALRRISDEAGGRLERWRYLDGDFRPLSESEPTPAGYDPRTRPWFHAASIMDGPVPTEPYVFSSTQSLGVTVSRRVPGSQGAVFGVDMTLESLSRFLAGERLGDSGLLFLFDAQGGLTGHPDPARLSRRGADGKPARASVEGLDDPRAQALFALFREQGARELPLRRLRVGDENHLVQVRAVPGLGSGQDFLALIAREADFTAPLERTRTQGLLAALALMCVAVPLLALASGRMARALAALADEADRIRNLNLDSCRQLRSRIDEVDRLGQAVSSMRSALSTFSRYLPRTLVRHFIDSGTDPVLGGERRELTVLFTDVENFTPLAENLAPEDLMQAMTEYFQLLGQAILDCGGTLDKFIGDAVMAFWNAPNAAEDHVEQACLAALTASRATEALNVRRAAAGLPLLRTRVGLHTGPAVVGNVGSADRMDYTALGANVNLASRMEGLNKYYDTRILVSRAVRERAKGSFLFRSVDVVQPKGAAKPVAVFELVGALPGSPHAAVAAPRASLGFCARWERAMTLYRTVQWEKALEEFSALAALNPADRLAAMYCTRARRLMENKPGKDWKAVERFKEK